VEGKVDFQQQNFLLNHLKSFGLLLLSFIPLGVGVRWIMRRIYTADKLARRIAFDPVAVGGIFISTKQLCSPIVGVRNCGHFSITFEPVCLDLTFSGYGPFDQITANVNPSVVKGGRTAQIAIPSYALSGERIQWMNHAFRSPTWVDIYFSGKLKCRTWFRDFDYPASILVRFSVRRD
jgi:hypothetical protein